MGLKVKVENDRLSIGEWSVTFMRTLRIPEDGEYPLPPGLGAFPLRRVEDYANRVPKEWAERGGVMLPVYQREAMWLSFDGPHHKPAALQVGVGKVNAVSGEEWTGELSDSEQNYVVVPEQPWLDGINSGDGFIKQFVAMPLGMGYTVEGQVTGEEKHGGVQLQLFAPKEGRFPDQPTYHAGRGGMLGGLESMDMAYGAPMAMAAAATPEAAGAAMGLGAGGRMKQSVYPDSHGLDTWDPESTGRVFVHLVDSLMWRQITGEEAPATPVTAALYASYGYPWFDLYDEDRGDVAASETLSKVKSLSEMDKEKGFAKQQDDTPIDVPASQVVTYGKDKAGVADGKW